MDYVKDGTLTIQARTIEEVNSIDRVVVYADGCEREYLMPVANGKWIEEYDEDAPLFLKRRWRCTACNGWQTYGKPKFCPNCGAKMIGE